MGTEAQEIPIPHPFCCPKNFITLKHVKLNNYLWIFCIAFLLWLLMLVFGVFWVCFCITVNMTHDFRHGLSKHVLSGPQTTQMKCQDGKPKHWSFMSILIFRKAPNWWLTAFPDIIMSFYYLFK